MLYNCTAHATCHAISVEQFATNQKKKKKKNCIREEVARTIERSTDKCKHGFKTSAELKKKLSRTPNKGQQSKCCSRRRASWPKFTPRAERTPREWNTWIESVRGAAGPGRSRACVAYQARRGGCCQRARHAAQHRSYLCRHGQAAAAAAARAYATPGDE